MGEQMNVDQFIGENNHACNTRLSRIESSRTYQMIKGLLEDEHVPVVPKLASRILAIVESGEGALEMGQWHTCGTTHCLAGWAVHLAGDAGYALEAEFSNEERAGSLIWFASTGSIPCFWVSNEEALADLRRRAAWESEEVQP